LSADLLKNPIGVFARSRSLRMALAAPAAATLVENYACEVYKAVSHPKGKKCAH
jgi:hypothetical protein